MSRSASPQQDILPVSEADDILSAVANAVAHNPQFAALKEMLAGDDDSCIFAACVLRRPTAPHQSDDTRGCDSTERFEYTCVAAGTGTRCVGYAPCEDAVEELLKLRDGHAEVMARRSFLAYLLDAADGIVAQNLEVRSTVRSAEADSASSPAAAAVVSHHPFVDVRCATEEDVLPSHEQLTFHLRGDVDLYMCCSELPCGDAALRACGETGARVLLKTPSGAHLEMLRTGSEGEKSGEGAADRDTAMNTALQQLLQFPELGGTVSVHGHQIVSHRGTALDGCAGVCRTKPGKGKENLNMACSDKMLRWDAVGIQGTKRIVDVPLKGVDGTGEQPAVARFPTIAQLFPEPIHLRGTVVISNADPHAVQAAVSYAVHERAQTLSSTEHRFESWCRSRAAWNGALTASRSRDPKIWKVAAQSIALHSSGLDAFSHGMWVKEEKQQEEGSADAMPSRKRARCSDHEDGENGATEESSAENAPLSRRVFFCSSLSRAALNMKQGLPRGMTATGFTQHVRRLHQRLASFAGTTCNDETRFSSSSLCVSDLAYAQELAVFPLSRLWFLVRSLILSERAAALTASNAAGSGKQTLGQQRRQQQPPSSQLGDASGRRIVLWEDLLNEQVSLASNASCGATLDPSWRLLWVEKRKST